MHQHGAKSIDPLAPRSALYQGPFGRICSDLPPWVPPGHLSEEQLEAHFSSIAGTRMMERPGLTPAQIAGDPALIEELEAEFGSEIPAGYTYFGQFIDHDITFDPASSLMRSNDPNALQNFRTPRLDLDNVYGRGAADQPYLYDPDDAAKLAIGRIAGSGLRDLPRLGERALIGDMRNDENAIVSQLQLAFLLAHNELVDRAREEGLPDAFESARQTLRWLYQHIVWNDFVRRIAAPDVWSCGLQLQDRCGVARQWRSELDFVYDWRNQPYMPVEFSVAAYRFGHSMVRNGYQTNQPHRGFGNFAPIFDNRSGGGDDLHGFRSMTPANSIQWDWFLPMTSSTGPFPQLARRIDTKLANALGFMHDAGGDLNVLAFRNLMRGHRFELPAGSAVARKYCIDAIELADGEPDALWFYILKEAELAGGNHLGTLGSIIVCAVFAGLLRGDPRSWLNMHPCWTPTQDPLLRDGEDNVDDEDWTLAAIIRIAGMPVDADDVTEQSDAADESPPPSAYASTNVVTAERDRPVDERRRRRKGKAKGRGRRERKRHRH
jgi:hypothetical protein